MSCVAGKTASKVTNTFVEAPHLGLVRCREQDGLDEALNEKTNIHWKFASAASVKNIWFKAEEAINLCIRQANLKT